MMPTTSLFRVHLAAKQLFIWVCLILGALMSLPASAQLGGGGGGFSWGNWSGSSVDVYVDRRASPEINSNGDELDLATLEFDPNTENLGLVLTCFDQNDNEYPECQNVPHFDDVGFITVVLSGNVFAVSLNDDGDPVADGNGCGFAMISYSNAISDGTGNITAAINQSGQNAGLIEGYLELRKSLCPIGENPDVGNEFSALGCTSGDVCRSNVGIDNTNVTQLLRSVFPDIAPYDEAGQTLKIDLAANDVDNRFCTSPFSIDGMELVECRDQGNPHDFDGLAEFLPECFFWWRNTVTEPNFTLQGGNTNPGTIVGADDTCPTARINYDPNEPEETRLRLFTNIPTDPVFATGCKVNKTKNQLQCNWTEFDTSNLPNTCEDGDIVLLTVIGEIDIDGLPVGNFDYESTFVAQQNVVCKNN